MGTFFEWSGLLAEAGRGVAVEANCYGTIPSAHFGDDGDDAGSDSVFVGVQNLVERRDVEDENTTDRVGEKDSPPGDISAPRGNRRRRGLIDDAGSTRCRVAAAEGYTAATLYEGICGVGGAAGEAIKAPVCAAEFDDSGVESLHRRRRHFEMQRKTGKGGLSAV